MIRFALLPETAAAVGALLSYLVHGLAWFAAAWLLVRPGLGLGPAARSRVWRLALVGPLLSTALALALPGGLYMFDVQLGGGVPSARPLVIVDEPGEVFALSLLAADAPPPSALPWPLFVLVALAGVACGRLLVLLARMRRFHRRLAGRRPVDDEGALALLSDVALAGRAGWPLRLTVSRHAASPMVLGRQEICLPPRALEELPDDALTMVLAHELAHLERRDNAWLAAAHVLEALLFVQPLFRIIRRHMQDAAELACDERAVELGSIVEAVGSPRFARARLSGAGTDRARMALARSIAAVASWELGVPGGVPVTAMIREPGAVVRRVAMLLHDRPPVSPGRRLLARLAPLLLVAAGLVAPTVGDRNEVRAAAAPAVVIPPSKAAAAATPFFWNQPARAQPGERRKVRRRWRAGVAIQIPPVPPLPPLPPLPPAVGLGQMQFDKRFEHDMEEWGEEVGRRMEEWSERFGKHMERWGEDMGRWGEEMGRRHEEAWGRRRQEIERRREEAERRREQAEARRDQDRARREQLEQREEQRQQRDEQRRERDEQRRQRDEQRRDQQRAQ